jgi:hypothetical protein
MPSAPPALRAVEPPPATAPAEPPAPARIEPRVAASAPIAAVTKSAKEPPATLADLFAAAFTLGD